MASGEEVDFKTAKSIHDFTVKDTFGNDVSLEKYRGYVVLICNIASRCGYTKKNYESLTKLNKEYYDKGLRILAFPCNQFGGQMPIGDGEDMVCHLKKREADIGDVFAKINCNGNSACSLYKYLKDKIACPKTGAAIKWNFVKFLVDKEGQVVNRYPSSKDPMDIAADIDDLL